MKPDSAINMNNLPVSSRSREFYSEECGSITRHSNTRHSNDISKKKINRVLKFIIDIMCNVGLVIFACMNIYIKYRVIEYTKSTEYHWICYLIILDACVCELSKFYVFFCSF